MMACLRFFGSLRVDYTAGLVGSQFHLTYFVLMPPCGWPLRAIVFSCNVRFLNPLCLFLIYIDGSFVGYLKEWSFCVPRAFLKRGFRLFQLASQAFGAFCIVVVSPTSA